MKRKKREIPRFTKQNFGMNQYEGGWDYRLHRSYICRKELENSISLQYITMDYILRRYMNENKAEPMSGSLRDFVKNYIRREEI